MLGIRLKNSKVLSNEEEIVALNKTELKNGYNKNNKKDNQEADDK